VETLAHIALIARHGAEWFRQVGTATQPGSALVTVVGAVAAPGVYEIPHGVPVMDLLAGAGDTTAPVRALLVGGYSGTWIDAGAVSGLTLDNDSLAHHGASFGPGIVVVLSGHACPVAEVARVATYLARESARQCGPCVHGLTAIAEGIGLVACGVAPPVTRDSLLRWLGQVSGRGACHHPDGAVRFVASALTVFAEDFEDHARHGPCEACAGPRELPLRDGRPSAVRTAA
jgi:NADH:ubiquinone oxidoreductase subunit F (NADH-binding)